MLKLKEIAIRTLSGAVFVAVVIAVTLLGGYWFCGLFTLFAAGGAFEFARLINRMPGRHVSPVCSVVGAVLMSVVMFLNFYVSSSSTFGGYVPAALCVVLLAYMLLVVGIFIGELFLYKGEPLSGVSDFLLCQVVAVLPFLLLMALATTMDGCGNIYVLMLFVTIWVNDTFAYLVGSTFGKHHFATQISPKKSWEGIAGGAVFALAVCVGCWALLQGRVEAFARLDWWEWVIFWFLAVTFGVLGDLLESMLKRMAGVKDSGFFMPGHGGVLDRFDSVLFATPAVFVLLILLELFQDSIVF